MFSVQVMPAVIGALGSVTKEFGRLTEKLEIIYNVGVMQKTFCNCKDTENICYDSHNRRNDGNENRQKLMTKIVIRNF